MWDNPAMTSLAGLGALTTVDEEVRIENNDALVSLDGLQGVGNDVIIHTDTALTDAAAWALVDEIDVIGGFASIVGN